MFNYFMELYTEMYNEIYYYIDSSKFYYNDINTTQSFYYYSDTSNQICECEKYTYNIDFDIDWLEEISKKNKEDIYNIHVTNLYRNEYIKILNNNNSI